MNVTVHVSYSHISAVHVDTLGPSGPLLDLQKRRNGPNQWYCKSQQCWPTVHIQ